MKLHARQGYYAFQDYAVQYGWEHFENSRGIDPAKEETAFHDTVESAGAFLKSYSLSTKFQESITVPQHDEIISFADEIPKDKRDRAERFNLGYRTINIRKQIEVLRCKDVAPEDLDLMNDLYGPHVIYKCHKPWCDFFLEGFGTEKERTQHTERHDRPFSCAEEDCFGFSMGFESISLLNHHIKEHHAGDTIQFPKSWSKKLTDDIWAAAERGEMSKVAAFLDQCMAGTPVSRPPHRTPLYLATLNGHLDVCKLLLERGRVFPMPREHYMRLVETATSIGRRDIWALIVSEQQAHSRQMVAGR